jgi:hypothetical protein
LLIVNSGSHKKINAQIFLLLRMSKFCALWSSPTQEDIAMNKPRHYYCSHKAESEILFEGPCAYVLVTGECHEILVHSSNYVTHKPAGMTDDRAKAERVCKCLNAYPRQTRAAYGLL